MRSSKLLVVLVISCTAIFLVPRISRSTTLASRPNILLITLDTTRWDHISCYTRTGPPTTPAIDMLSRQGVLYEHAISPSSWTLPAHASIFTGMLPSQHEAGFTPAEKVAAPEKVTVPEDDSNVFRPLHPTIPTLAEQLKKANFDTAAIIGGFFLHSQFGLNRGFDYYDDHFDARQWFDRNADDITFEAVRWLKKRLRNGDNKPFFLFLNYFDPHDAYQPPPPWGDPDAPQDIYDIFSTDRYSEVFRGNRDVTNEERDVLSSQYNAEIRFMDSEIGRLIQQMKRMEFYDSTMIIIVADHGESLGEHRLLGHTHALYENVVRVPLIIKYPIRDNKRGKLEHPVSIVSIMPTILEYLALPIPETSTNVTLDDENQNLVSEIFRNKKLIQRHGKRFDRSLKALYDGDYKWIWNSNGKHELYNLKEDSYEKHNLAGKLPEVEQRFMKQFDSLAERSDRYASDDIPELSKELKEQLKTLGYIN